MKLHMNENIELNEDDSKCFATLWTAYIDDEYKCVCCGKKFPEGHGTVYLGGHKPDGMHFIYEYTKENRVGNSINYDPYNLPPEDETGGIFKVVVGEEEDEEGYNWLNFCRNCWPKLTNMSPDEIYAKYNKDTVTESSKLCESSENAKNYCFQRMIDYYGPEYGLTDEQIRKAAEMWYQKLVDTASYYPFGCVDLFGASEDTIEDAYDSGLLDEDEYNAFMNDNYPECFAEESINDVLNTVTEDFDDDSKCSTRASRRSPKTANVYRILDAMDWNKPTFMDATSSGYRLKWGNRSEVEKLMKDGMSREDAFAEIQKDIDEIKEKTGIQCIMNRNGYIVVPYSEVNNDFT